MATKAKDSKAYKMYKDYVGFKFESDTKNTKEFNSFATKFKNAVIEQAKMAIDWELEVFEKGHFYCYGFLKSQTKGTYMYFSIADVRDNDNAWFEKMLIRTAEGPKDFKGGMNKYCRLDKLNEFLN